MTKSKKKFWWICIAWVILFVIFSDITDYLIQSGLAANHGYWVLIVELGWLALGWFCFWIDYKYRPKKTKK